VPAYRHSRGSAACEDHLRSFIPADNREILKKGNGQKWDLFNFCDLSRFGPESIQVSPVNRILSSLVTENRQGSLAEFLRAFDAEYAVGAGFQMVFGNILSEMALSIALPKNNY
jgi:hypothetical protein